MSRYSIAAIAAAITFPAVWYVARLGSVLVANAIAKSREDFPPPTVEGGPWPVLLAAMSASLVAYLIMRRG